MFFQLGNIVFEGLLSPNSISHDGDEAVFAEHELIGSKPRLQKTGDTLKEITFEAKLHASFCNPEDQINELKTLKDAGTILPLLIGNGKYTGDFVIISFPYSIDNSLPDGTVVQATVTVTLKEYLAFNKLEQKELAARKAAFAVGDKNPIIQRPAQLPTETTNIALLATSVKLQSTVLDKQISEYSNNVSQRPIIAKRILEACSKANTSLTDLQTSLVEAENIADTFTGIPAVAANVQSSVNAIINLSPFSSIDNLKSANTNLQSVVRIFTTTVTPLFQAVITRENVPAILP